MKDQIQIMNYKPCKCFFPTCSSLDIVLQTYILIQLFWYVQRVNSYGKFTAAEIGALSQK